MRPPPFLPRSFCFVSFAPLVVLPHCDGRPEAARIMQHQDCIRYQDQHLRHLVVEDDNRFFHFVGRYDRPTGITFIRRQVHARSWLVHLFVWFQLRNWTVCRSTETGLGPILSYERRSIHLLCFMRRCGFLRAFPNWFYRLVSNDSDVFTFCGKLRAWPRTCYAADK